MLGSSTGSGAVFILSSGTAFGSDTVLWFLGMVPWNGTWARFLCMFPEYGYSSMVPWYSSMVPGYLY